jgi:hypothetical protein
MMVRLSNPTSGGAWGGLVHLIHLVYLVCLVYLVSLVCFVFLLRDRNRQDRPAHRIDRL